jgi:hypothetical protein
MPRALQTRDFWAGALFAMVGALGLFLARNLAMGTAVRMGPGYVPRVLAGLVVAFGVVIMLRGLAGGAAAIERGRLRPLAVVLVAIVVFALLIDRAGLIAAAVALTLISRWAGSEHRPAEALFFAIVLALASAALFVGLLGLPYRLWPAWG